jgi:hypothetical protein
VDPFPEVPLGAPTWDGRVQRIPRQEDWDYPQATAALTNLRKEGQTVNIFSEGALSNRNLEDGKQVGAASAVLYHNGREWKHAERVFGEMVTENGTVLRSFIPAPDMFADFIDNQPIDSAFNILIPTPSSFAVNRVLDASPHEEQAVSQDCLKSLGELFDAHLNMDIRLLWLPRNIPTVGFKRAK